MDGMKVKAWLTLAAFKHGVENGVYKDSTDGVFMLADENEVSDKQVLPSDVKDFQFADYDRVVWLVKE